MTYNLNLDRTETVKRTKTFDALKKLLLILAGEKKNLILSLMIILVHSVITLIGPLLIGRTIDKYIQTKQFHGVLIFAGILLGLYLITTNQLSANQINGWCWPAGTF
jgi:ATP-binding cassette subfamily B protein